MRQDALGRLKSRYHYFQNFFLGFLAGNESSLKFHTLFIGGLRSFPEMSARLAIFSKQSPLWDSKQGRQRSGQINQVIIKLANQGQVYDEWQKAFNRHNVKILVSGVENVSVARAGDLPYFDELQTHGINAPDRLPYDCLIWFSLTRETTNN